MTIGAYSTYLDFFPARNILTVYSLRPNALDGGPQRLALAFFDILLLESHRHPLTGIPCHGRREIESVPLPIPPLPYRKEVTHRWYHTLIQDQMPNERREVPTFDWELLQAPEQLNGPRGGYKGFQRREANSSKAAPEGRGNRRIILFSEGTGGFLCRA